MKTRVVREGQWTPGADSTLIIGDWQAWVDGEGHWKVRGPDPDDEAHDAAGRKIRAQRAKKAARSLIQSMQRPSKAHHHSTKKTSPAQLDREIAEVVPGWARGLDLTESRELAKRLGTIDVEAKQRRIESDCRAALPSLAITDVRDGIFVRVSSPGPGYGRYHAVVDVLRASEIPLRKAIPPNIFVPVHKAADKTKARTRVEEALRYAGYRV
jgi:hypothetical protein